MLDADCRLINLECVISDRGEEWHPTTKAFHFRAGAGATLMESLIPASVVRDGLGRADRQRGINRPSR
jgi:hypothetical protein